VPGDQQLTGSPGAEQFNPHEERSDNHGVNAVHSDGVDGMEIRQRFASQPTEGNVSADLRHGAARLDPSHDIPSRQVLVFKAYL
jgi:hypothetical protein